MKNQKTTKSTLFHKGLYGVVRDWKAYGNGVLARKGSELYAYTLPGEESLLVTCLRDDAADIGREWSYHPYSRGAILYEWSRRLGHEGMEIDKRVVITAHPDEGKGVTLYDTKDQYILPQIDWTTSRSGIVVAEKDEGWNGKKEKTFILCSDDGSKKMLYHGECDEWKPQSRGIIIRQGNSYLAGTANGGKDTQPQKIIEFADAEYWTGYGRGLILGKGNELWAFRNEPDGSYSRQIFQGEWKKKAQPHLPELPCFKPCREGIVMELEKELVLYRDYATPELLYAEEWKRWDVYDDLLVVEHLHQEEKKIMPRWSAVKMAVKMEDSAQL